MSWTEKARERGRATLEARRISLVGRMFGRLTVIAQAPHKIGHQRRWICRCTCGNEKIVQQGALVTGNTRSCGCLRVAPPITKRSDDVAKPYAAVDDLAAALKGWT